jgi:hypothetical protein
MPRGGIRRSRVHQMGKSNRPRVSKLADEVVVRLSSPNLSFADGNSQVGEWKKICKLNVAPRIEVSFLHILHYCLSFPILNSYLQDILLFLLFSLFLLFFTLQRTPLGGTILRPASRCTAERFQHILKDHDEEHVKSSWMQEEWVNAQPLLGISEWSKGEAPRAMACFSVTDDIFD